MLTFLIGPDIEDRARLRLAHRVDGQNSERVARQRLQLVDGVLDLDLDRLLLLLLLDRLQVHLGTATCLHLAQRERLLASAARHIIGQKWDLWRGRHWQSVRGRNSCGDSLSTHPTRHSPGGCLLYSTTYFKMGALPSNGASQRSATDRLETWAASSRLGASGGSWTSSRRCRSAEL